MGSSNSSIVKILAFGDSLTEGYLMYSEFHPYAISLQKELQNAFPERKFEITVAGFSGFTVENLLSKELQTYKAEKYDYVIILGGTNNLSIDEGEPLFNKLQKLHTQFLEANASTRTIAVSIPELYYGGEMYKEDVRNYVNTNLKQMAEQSEGKTQYFDLASQIPNGWNAVAAKRMRYSTYWSDNIHFSAEGYDLFGKLLAEFLIPQL